MTTLIYFIILLVGTLAFVGYIKKSNKVIKRHLSDIEQHISLQDLIIGDVRITVDKASKKERQQ